MKAAFCKRLYEIKKLQFKLKKNAVLLTRKYILKEKERYLLRISYTKHENSISFRIMDLKNIEKPADAKQKLYENFSLNELKHFANSIYARVILPIYNIYKYIYIINTLIGFYKAPRKPTIETNSPSN